jgi:hypothetical protein
MKAASPADPRPTRSASIAIVAATIVFLTLLSPRPANAGEYTIYACQADEAGYVSSAFDNFATRGMKWRRACDPRGKGLRGLVTANVPRAGRVEKGAQSGFIQDAPPGTTFSRFRWSGQARRRDCRYALQLFAQRPDGSPISMKNVRANRGCPRPGMAQASGAPFPRAYAGVLVEVAGQLQADPGSGRLTATFDRLPQLPYSSLTMHFREGQRSPLATPHHLRLLLDLQRLCSMPGRLLGWAISADRG